MRNSTLALLICLLGLSTLSINQSQAQLSGITDALFGESTVDTLSSEPEINLDSIKITELEDQLQQMRLNEAIFMEELEISRESLATDSLKEVRRYQRIDSLRKIVKGAPIVVDKDTLFTVYSSLGGVSFKHRAAETQKIIEDLGREKASKSDSIFLLKLERMTEIMSGERVIYSVTTEDAIWMATSVDSLAKHYKTEIKGAIKEIQKKNNFFSKLKRAGLFILVIALQVASIWLVNFYYRKGRRTLSKWVHSRFKPIKIRDYEFLDTSRQSQIAGFLLNILRYLILAIMLLFTLPLLFSIFPATREFASLFLGYILNPIKGIGIAIINFIPDLFIILIIWISIRYVIKGIGFLSNEIESGKLKITGFYPDWARPTYSIVRFLLYAFMIAMIYPHLPGSDSPVFKGISVFVGLIVSLGSSGVVGNIISGMIITYMRPFRLGDRIELDNTIGNVIEKTPLVTRIRTPKNEVITLPNSFVMSNKTVNYTIAATNYGLIIHTTIGIGYDVTWQRAHEILIRAARNTPGVLPDREPFVFELQFKDTCAVYQINAYIDQADNYSKILSDLHNCVQNALISDGVVIENFVFQSRNDRIAGGTKEDGIIRRSRPEDGKERDGAIHTRAVASSAPYHDAETEAPWVGEDGFW